MKTTLGMDDVLDAIGVEARTQRELVELLGGEWKRGDPVRAVVRAKIETARRATRRPALVEEHPIPRAGPIGRPQKPWQLTAAGRFRVAAHRAARRAREESGPWAVWEGLGGVESVGRLQVGRADWHDRRRGDWVVIEPDGSVTGPRAERLAEVRR